MKPVHCAILVAAILLASPWSVNAQSAPLPAEMPLLQRITITGSDEQRQQIIDAITAAPQLSRRLDGLSTKGSLTGIDVIESKGPDSGGVGPIAAAAPVRGPFAAVLDGSRIVMSASLIAKLRRGRLSDVGAPDDVLPNQTVFVLAHLADHLASATPMSPQPGEGIEAYRVRRMGEEAHAFIAAWNATLDEAVRRGGGTALNARQIATLLLNIRYRFALLGNRQANVPGPVPEKTGEIDATPANLDAIVRTLERAAIADLE